MKNDMASLENSLRVSHEDKHILTCDLAIPLLCIYPRKIINLCTNVYSNTVHNHKKLEKNPDTLKTGKWVN
jgi:hypothetical protein